MFIPLLILVFSRPLISSLAYPYLNYLYSAVLLGFIISWIILKGAPIQELKPIASLFFLLIAISISIIFASNKASFQLELYKYIIGIFILLICRTLCYKDKIILIKTMVATGISISFIAIYQYFFEFQQLLSQIDPNNQFYADIIKQKRAFSPFVTPNALGGYLAMIIPLTLSFKKYRVWIIIPLFFALLLTKSMGAIICIFIALLIYSFLRGKITNNRIIALIGLVILFFIVFISRVFAHRDNLQPLFSTTMRLSYWKDSLMIIKAHPLVCLGLGNFNLEYSRFAHNSYLQIWAEIGIFGIISFFWFIIAILKLGLINLKGSIDKAVEIGLICSICVFLIHNLIDFTFFLPEINLIWWAMLGLLLNNNTVLGRKTKI